MSKIVDQSSTQKLEKSKEKRSASRRIDIFSAEHHWSSGKYKVVIRGFTQRPEKSKETGSAPNENDSVREVGKKLIKAGHEERDNV